MNTDPAPLVNKLILVVLTLILGCLVIMIVRQRPAEQIVPEAASGRQDERIDLAVKETPVPVRYLPVTNRAIIRPAQNNVTRQNTSAINQPLATRADFPDSPQF